MTRETKALLAGGGWILAVVAVALGFWLTLMVAIVALVRALAVPQ